ncbi:MAG TPA: LysR family transcriptional regulator [Devosia sp.]|nr:LysR family transcriptional regulator [Devosia sp.]
MEIDLLKTFIAICDAKSFTAAARQVGRTQSAVSLQMKRLEVSLGRPLFQRGAPGVVLTEHGAMLVPNARRILAAVDETRAIFDRASVDGIFVIGMPDDYAPRILVPTLQAFGALFPLASVDIVIDESRTLVKRLAEGSVDLAFVTEGEGPMSGGPTAFEDEMVWVAPLVGDLHLRDPIPIAVWDDDQDTYARYMRMRLEELSRSYRTVVVARSMTGLRGAVASGLAVSAMMRSSLTADIRELKVGDAFSPLARLSIRLEKAHMKKSAVVDALQQALLVAAAKGVGHS